MQMSDRSPRQASNHSLVRSVRRHTRWYARVLAAALLASALSLNVTPAAADDHATHPGPNLVIALPPIEPEEPSSILGSAASDAVSETATAVSPVSPVVARAWRELLADELVALEARPVTVQAEIAHPVLAAAQNPTVQQAIAVTGALALIVALACGLANRDADHTRSRTTPSASQIGGAM